MYQICEDGLPPRHMAGGCIVRSCRYGWSGLEDVHYETFYRGYRDFRSNLNLGWSEPALFIAKMATFKRYEESECLTREWLDWIIRGERLSSIEVAKREYYDPISYGVRFGAYLIHTGTPRDLLPSLLDLTFRNLHYCRQTGEKWNGIPAGEGALYEQILDRAPPRGGTGRGTRNGVSASGDSA